VDENDSGGRINECGNPCNDCGNLCNDPGGRSYASGNLCNECGDRGRGGGALKVAGSPLNRGQTLLDADPSTEALAKVDER
jgi:hypothetical protein